MDLIWVVAKNMRLFLDFLFPCGPFLHIWSMRLSSIVHRNVKKVINVTWVCAVDFNYTLLYDIGSILFFFSE